MNKTALILGIFLAVTTAMAKDTKIEGRLCGYGPHGVGDSHEYLCLAEVEESGNTYLFYASGDYLVQGDWVRIVPLAPAKEGKTDYVGYLARRMGPASYREVPYKLTVKYSDEKKQEAVATITVGDKERPEIRLTPPREF